MRALKPKFRRVIFSDGNYIIDRKSNRSVAGGVHECAGFDQRMHPKPLRSGFINLKAMLPTKK